MQIQPQGDTFKIRIEDDGTISMVTGKMSAEIHRTAQEFLEDVIRMSGGMYKTEHLEKMHVHTHTHQQGGHVHACA
jgi:hypothetical protein